VCEYHRDEDCHKIISLVEHAGLKLFRCAPWFANRGEMGFARPGARLAQAGDVITMPHEIAASKTIPQWRINEVKAYDLPFDFTPATILDIGANIGCYSMRCHKKWPKALIWAYEPVPSLVDQLAVNCPDIAITCAGVRATDETSPLFQVDGEDTWGSFYENGHKILSSFQSRCISAKSL